MKTTSHLVFRLYRLFSAFLIAGLIFGQFSSPLKVNANTAPVLTITPLTWNVVGLDSNNVNVGPNIFPVGARVCNEETQQATGVTSSLNWDSSDPYIDYRTGSNKSYSGYTLDPHQCVDFYYEIEVSRDPNAYDHTRRYHIDATASGYGSNSSPTPREIYVEHLVSQNRNSVTKIELDGVSVPNGGTLAMVVGKTYNIKLTGNTSTNGYNQLESFINLANTIFKINSVTSTYGVTSLTPPYDRLYADSCGWDNNPLNPTYRSCIVSDGKTGGEVTANYNVTIMSGAGTNETLNTMLFDFSGSSYHYNSDFTSSGRIISISAPITFSKAFSPVSIAAGGTSTLTFTLKNTGSSPVSGISFSDTLPSSAGQMTVINPASAGTTGCGSPSFAPTLGATKVSFSNGTIAANGTCTVSVQVTVPSSPASDIYPNLSDHVFVNGADTSLTASANLSVATNTSTGSCSAVLASWNFSAGNATYSSKASDVNTALASVSSGLTSNNSFDGSTYVSSPYSWQGKSGFGTGATLNLSTDQYFLFHVDTRKYTNVKMSFSYKLGASGPVDLHVYSSDTTTAKNALKDIMGIASTSWLSSGTVDATNKTYATDPTYFFLFANHAPNNGANSTLNIDDVTFTGCQTPQTITKSFTPAVVAVGGISHLKFTLGNSNATNYTGVGFTDPLPANLQIAASPNPVVTNCGSSYTLTAAANSNSISLANGGIAANSSCTIQVDVTPTKSGSYTNVTGFISSTEEGTNTGTDGSASATLAAVAAPTFTKSFSPNRILAGGATSLIFTVANPNSVEMTGIGFSDTLPGLLVVASGTQTTSGCSSSTTPSLTATASTNSISISNVSIAAGGACVVSIPVSAPSVGTFDNTSDPLTLDVSGLTAPVAEDTLYVTTVNPEIRLAKQISRQSNGPWSSFLVLPPGTPLYYRLTVENAGDVDLSGVQVNDPLLDLSGCTQFTGPLTLTTNDTKPTASCVIGPITAQQGDFLNRAAAVGTYSGSTYSASATAEYIGAEIDPDNPRLSLTKQISTAPTGPWTSSITNVDPDSKVYYRFTLVNTGNQALSTLHITDPLVDTSLCSFIDPLPSGGASVCIVDPVNAVAGLNPNTARASSGTPSLYSNYSTALYISGSFTISGTLWLDDDKDGSIDGSETRLLNGSVRLYKDDGVAGFNPNTDILLGTQYTDASGAYAFGALPTGNYYVVPGSVAGYHLPEGVSPLFLSLNDNSTGNDFGYQPDPKPDLTVSKTNSTSDGTNPLEDTFTWTLLVQNQGGGDATFYQGDILLTDTLPQPANVAYDQISASDPAISCAIDSGVLTCSVTATTFTIASGDSLTVSYRAQSSVAASLTNSAVADPTGKVVEEDENNNTGSDTVAVVAPPAISLKFSDASIQLGNTSTLTYTLTNPNAAIGLLGVAFSDQLPSGLTVVSATSSQCGGTLTVTAPDTIVLSGGSLAADDSCTIALTVTGATAGLKSTTTSAITSTNGGSGNQASGSITVVNPASPVALSILKSHDGEFVRGSTGTYTLVVSNGQGAGDTSGEVTVSDSLPTGLSLHATPSGSGWDCVGDVGASAFTCTRSDVLSASSSYPAITAVVDVGASTASEVTNTGVVSGGGDPTPGSSDDLTEVNSLPLARPDVNTAVLAGPVVSKTAATGLLSNDDLGDEPTIIRAASQGGVDITLGVPFTTANGGSLTLNEDGSYSYTPPTTGTIPPGGLVEVFDYTLMDYNEDSSSSTLTITVVMPAEKPDFIVTKTNDTDTGTVPAGSSFTWNLEVRNAGLGDATITAGQALLQDALPTTGATYALGTVTYSSNTSGTVSCALEPDTLVVTCSAEDAVSVPAGESFNVPILVSNTTAGALVNPREAGICQVNPGGELTEKDTENNDCTPNTVSVIAPPQIAKSFAVDWIWLNGATTLSYTLTNPNASTALTGVAFTDVLPAGLVVTSATSTACSGALTLTPQHTITLVGGNIAGGDSCTFDVTVAGIQSGTQDSTSGQVTSANGGNGNTAFDTIDVVTPPDLTITKNNNVSGSAALGSSFTWTLTVHNTGDGDAPISSGQTLLVDDLPATGASYQLGDVQYSVAMGGSVVCNLDAELFKVTCGSDGSFTLPAGESFSVSVTVTPTTAGSLVNPRVDGLCQVNPNGDVAEENRGNNDCTPNTVTVVAPPAISLAFSDSSILVGNTSTLTFTLTNPNAAIGLLGVAFSDQLPAGLTVASATSSQCGGALTVTAPSTIALSGGSLAAAGTCTIDLTVTGATAGLKSTTTSAITSTNGGAGNQASGSITVVNPAGPTTYSVYLPLVSASMDQLVPTSWNLFLGYEDLPLQTGHNDFDYNDWTVEVAGTSYTVQTATANLLKKLDLSFIPKARGGTYSHAFQIQFPAGVFASDGTATLTLYDGNHSVVSTQKIALASRQVNTFTLFSDTSKVFPGSIINTVEGRPLVPPQYSVDLTIDFDTPFAFSIKQSDLGLPHGTGLFFDPFLVVKNTGEEVHRGDLRFLNVPSATWLWPEENVRIDRAYPQVSYQEGNPPMINFPLSWWTTSTHCVYDGTKCGTP